MKFFLDFALLALALVPLGQNPPADAAKAKLVLESTKQVYRLGERIVFQYRIQNDGSVPFYMNPSLAQVGGMDAGVRIALFDEQGNRVSGQIVGDIPSPNYAAMSDIVKYIGDNWLLLGPRLFYGTSSYYPTLSELKVGKYRMQATYFSNLLYDIGASQKTSLAEHLPHPLLTGEIRSNEVWIQIVAN